MDEFLRAVKALQTADGKQVTVPANCPGSELIGDNVIVPQPCDVKEARTRLQERDVWLAVLPQALQISVEPVLTQSRILP